jgi:adenine-specific DNA-methyltransferase
VIKYLGSKRLLVEHIVSVCETLRPHSGTVLDLFSGTSRVGHALKNAGFGVIANDHNSYAHTLAMCYIQADAARVERDATRIIHDLNALPGRDGPFTETYCRAARYFTPENGARIESMREHIEALGLEPELRAVVLTSLIEAADRVDSTTGVQMAYLKSWAPRALKPIELRLPNILPHPEGQPCRAFQLDALEAAHGLSADIAYLDPPYNQHSYLGNYHVWETLVRWDDPETYGVACKRIDCRERKSHFNSKVRIEDALRSVIDAIDARTLILSFNDEGYLDRDQIESMLSPLGPLAIIDHDHPRYVGCKIGIHNQRGEKVGRVGKVRNTEHFFIAGEGAELFMTENETISVAG